MDTGGRYCAFGPRFSSRGESKVKNSSRNMIRQNEHRTESFKTKRRLILDTPFSVRNIISYGLIVYAQDTRRWIIVQRKHSVEFLLFIRGMYRLTHLPLLLAHITPTESDIINECLKEGPQMFEDLYLNTLGLCQEGLEYALIRMAESRTVTLNLLKVLELSNNTLSWTWPKGRLTYNHNDSNSERETPFDCAKREFLEEVEIDLPIPVSISNTYISEIVRTITGRNIESRYWIYIIPNEIALSSPVDHPEVASRLWTNTEECRKLVQHDDLFDRIVEAITDL